MAVSVNEEKRIFKLDTINTSYIVSVMDEPGYAGHVYYGKRISDEDVTYLLRIQESPFVPSKNKRDKISFMDSAPFEYPAYGSGDYRDAALKVRTEDGMTTSELHYSGYRLDRFEGGQVPGVYGDNGQELTIELEDRYMGIKAELKYIIFE
ncbi:MAG: alpha-galactosidase, partial [Lachnospiraceae bacterium]|nr:alpha-galactosidase [Lachnospiraceae bacterium]